MNNNIINLQHLQIEKSATLKDAISVINEGHVQIAFVVEKSGRLCGTVTDGDIRRALLRGETLEVVVEKVMNTDFKALSKHATETDALLLMRTEMLNQIPVIDENGRLVWLYLLKELIEPKKRSNIVIIMAGGEGKRLYPLTQDIPKPMLQVGGKPLLEIIIEQCIDAGFHHFCLAVNYLKEKIQDYFGNGDRWNVKIEYLEEKKPLGTGGALALLNQVPREPFLVLNGDILTKVDYNRLINFHDEQEFDATLCVREHKTELPYGVVETQGMQLINIDEKPTLSHYVNAGIYFLEPEMLRFVPADAFFDMPQLLEKIIENNHRVGAFPIHEYWLDIGRPETLKRAHGEWV